MKGATVTCIACIACVVSLVTSVTEQIFKRKPESQSANQGDHVTLPCRVDNKQGELQWTRDDFGLGINRSLHGFDRYQMIGSDAEGGCQGG